LSFFAAAGLTLFILILFTGIFLNFLGLPGTIVIFFDVLCYAMVTGFEQIGWQVIVLLLVAAVAAETIEFFWVVSEAPQQESSPRKSLKTVAVGAVAGGFLLTPFLLGPGAWIGFFLGGLAGILIAEILVQYRLKAPHRTLNRVMLNIVGKNAVKGFISLGMIAFSLSNIYS